MKYYFFQNIGKFEICSIFAVRFVHLHIENVIKKGGETRLCETLATLAIRQEGATFYPNFGNR